MDFSKYQPSIIEYLEVQGLSDVAEIAERMTLEAGNVPPGLADILLSMYRHGIYVNLSVADYHFLEKNGSVKRQLIRAITTVIAGQLALYDTQIRVETRIKI